VAYPLRGDDQSTFHSHLRELRPSHRWVKRNFTICAGSHLPIPGRIPFSAIWHSKRISGVL
jgi:hypothetical protein